MSVKISLIALIALIALVPLVAAQKKECLPGFCWCHLPTMIANGVCVPNAASCTQFGMKGVVCTENEATTSTNGKVLALVEHADTDADGARFWVKDKDTMGDMIAFANPIYDGSNTKKIGSDSGFCVRTKVAPQGMYECSWTTFLDDGSLSVQGPFADEGDTVRYVVLRIGCYVSSFTVFFPLQNGRTHLSSIVFALSVRFPIIKTDSRHCWWHRQI